MDVKIDGEGLTIEDVVAVARKGAKIVLPAEARARVEECARLVQKLVDSGKAIYGVTTGIGEFARIRISKEDGEALQRKIIYSHSAGTGDPLPEEYVRAAILCRSNTLSKGYSGVRLQTLETYMEMANRGISPVVYEKGSLGASGDLSPLAQLAEVALGEGEAFYGGKRIPGKVAMKAAGLTPIVPTFKEGLGLINGSQLTAGMAALCVHDAEQLVKVSEIASAMTLDAVRGVTGALDARAHELRKFPGQIKAAEHIRRMITGSQILAQPELKVQDAYSLRCIPQIIGASRDAVAHARTQIETEMNALVDNPIFIVRDGQHVSCGNFHGQYVGFALEHMAIAVAELASVSERHTNRMMNPILSGLPDFLVEGKGLNSGLMVAQYTAAALVTENKVLAHPAVVDSISVSADQEDHVSMANTSANKLRVIIRNTGAALSVQIMAAAQALDFRKPLLPGKGVQAVHALVRRHVKHLDEDRPLHPDIEAVRRLVLAGSIIKAAEGAVGKLD
ncbi:MAG: histidine ammonia-lyase [Euryarchaeota archaeon]|nr:histidine ammonia-lyase [Euryarchaeota archaeon]